MVNDNHIIHFSNALPFTKRFYLYYLIGLRLDYQPLVTNGENEAHGAG